VTYNLRKGEKFRFVCRSRHCSVPI